MRSLKKVGDVVRLCSQNYPQYKEHPAMLVELRYNGRWIVLVNGKLHRYVIDEVDMRGLNESR